MTRPSVSDAILAMRDPAVTITVAILDRANPAHRFFTDTELSPARGEGDRGDRLERLSEAVAIEAVLAYRAVLVASKT